MSGFEHVQPAAKLSRTEQALVTHAERHAAGSRAGGSSSRCCSAFGRATRCGRSAAGCAAARAAHLGIRRRVARRWPTRTNIGLALRAVFEACAPVPAAGQGRRKFRFKNKLVSLDSTVIDLCATCSTGQSSAPKGRQLHCLLDHDGYLPSVVVITEGKRHDVRWPAPCASIRALVVMVGSPTMRGSGT